MRKLEQAEKERVDFILEDKLCCDLDNIKSDSLIRDDLGADSLDEIEICMELEKEFNINIPDLELEKVKTVSDLYECVEKFL